MSISLNKFISSTGICSRREADEMIDAGRVKLNGVIAKKGNRVEPGNTVLLDGTEVVNKTKPLYFALNKPPGITCTTDLSDKDNIISFINYPERIFPIGRLDKASSGLILLTNNGDIVNSILRSENEHEKEYIVSVNRPISPGFIKKMSRGVPVLGKMTKHCEIEQIAKTTFRIVLTQGMNRQIRRMCEFMGYTVLNLKRIRIMHIQLGRLKMGELRALTAKELAELGQEIKMDL